MYRLQSCFRFKKRKHRDRWMFDYFRIVINQMLRHKMIKCIVNIFIKPFTVVRQNIDFLIEQLFLTFQYYHQSLWETYAIQCSVQYTLELNWVNFFPVIFMGTHFKNWDLFFMISMVCSEANLELPITILNLSWSSFNKMFYLLKAATNVGLLLKAESPMRK